jgi:LmbE family N-acetylglucosaminyl deacetylase
VLNVVAHPDDDLLFLSPDLIHDITRANQVRTVFLTAGDAGLAPSYWQARERGSRAAYAFMAQRRDQWHEVSSGAGNVAAQALSAAPHVSVVFLRLPDGGAGEGFARYGGSSLGQVIGRDRAITSVDRAVTYTRGRLMSALAGLMNDFAPTLINTLDPRAAEEHSDHRATARLVMRAVAAIRPVGRQAPVTRYLGYAGQRLPANLIGAELRLKRAAFERYAAHDPHVCLDGISCPGGRYQRWLARQYRSTGSRGS